jgi:hypothetical protein
MIGFVVFVVTDRKKEAANFSQAAFSQLVSLL